MQYLSRPTDPAQMPFVLSEIRLDDGLSCEMAALLEANAVEDANRVCREMRSDHRGGSVCLNSAGLFCRWISAPVTLLLGLAAAG